MKLEYIVVCENSSDEFDIEHHTDHGQGHCRPVKNFPTYHNTNSQVL